MAWFAQTRGPPTLCGYASIHAELNWQAVGSFGELSGAVIERATLDRATKCTPLLPSSEGRIAVPDGCCKISKYGAFKRGIATRANEFFVSSASKIREWQIPNEMTHPCIMKSRHCPSQHRLHQAGATGRQRPGGAAGCRGGPTHFTGAWADDGHESHPDQPDPQVSGDFLAPQIPA